MKIIFFGTPDYVVPIVDHLHKVFHVTKQKESGVIAVVTQPPKQVGRDRLIDHSPVDKWAWCKKIQIITNIKTQELPVADLGVVAAYGVLIPKNCIDHFPYGIVNIHPSLLPAFRGASPVQAALVTGTNPTGLTVIQMDELMDHGQIISQFKEEVLPDDTTESLRVRLFDRSAKFLTDLLPNYLAKKIRPKSQDDQKATFTKTVTRDDGYIPPDILQLVTGDQWSKKEAELKINFIKDYSLRCTPETIYRFICAMTPWPGAWTKIVIGDPRSVKSEKRLKVLEAHLSQSNSHQPQLVLDLVQLESKNPVSWEEFKRGYPSVILTTEGE